MNSTGRSGASPSAGSGTSALAPARPLLSPELASATLVDGEPRLTLLPLASSGDSSGLVGANALVPLPATGLDLARAVEYIDCS